jgi:hypothetical protein
MSNANQNIVSQISLENVSIAINRANDRWSAKTGNTGVCEDLKTAQKFWDESLCTFLAGMLKRAKIDEITFLATIADNMGVKAVKRVSEFLSCLNAKDYSKLDGVTSLSLLSAMHAGAVSRSALTFATTGKGGEMVKVAGHTERQLQVNAKSPFIGAIAKMVEQASTETLSLVKGAKKD